MIKCYNWAKRLYSQATGHVYKTSNFCSILYFAICLRSHSKARRFPFLKSTNSIGYGCFVLGSELNFIQMKFVQLITEGKLMYMCLVWSLQPSLGVKAIIKFR